MRGCLGDDMTCQNMSQRGGVRKMGGGSCLPNIYLLSLFIELSLVCKLDFLLFFRNVHFVLP